MGDWVVVNELDINGVAKMFETGKRARQRLGKRYRHQCRQAPVWKADHGR